MSRSVGDTDPEKPMRAYSIGAWEESEQFQRAQTWALVVFFVLLFGISAGPSAWRGDWFIAESWAWGALYAALGCGVWSLAVLVCVRFLVAFGNLHRGTSSDEPNSGMPR